MGETTPLDLQLSAQPRVRVFSIAARAHCDPCLLTFKFADVLWNLKWFLRTKKKIWKYVQECFIPSENQGEVSPWWYYSLSSHLQGLREFPLNICVLFSAKCLIQGEVRFPRFFGLTVPGSNNRALIQEIVLNIQIKFFFVLFPPFTYNYNSSFMLNNNSPLPLWGSSIPQVSVGCSFPQATLVTI